MLMSRCHQLLCATYYTGTPNQTVPALLNSQSK